MSLDHVHDLFCLAGVNDYLLQVTQGSANSAGAPGLPFKSRPARRASCLSKRAELRQRYVCMCDDLLRSNPVHVETTFATPLLACHLCCILLQPRLMLYMLGESLSGLHNSIDSSTAAVLRSLSCLAPMHNARPRCFACSSLGYPL